MSRHVFATVDMYFNRKVDFVTALLPATAVNPNFRPWAAPSTVPPSERQAVQDAVRQALAGTPAEFGLTRLPDGSTAVVLSFGNAGLVLERGIELGVAAWLTKEIQLSGSYAYYDFDIERQQPGSGLQPNTPRHKGRVSFGYEGHSGIDVQVSTR